MSGAASPVAVRRRPSLAAARDHPFLVATVACVALAALSAAVLPTVPSYDPWSWVVWGKEVFDPHLSFFVGGGPSWKPLPVVFTAVFGLFGGGAPTLWVIAARAGGLLGVVAAYRLAARITAVPGWSIVAGLVAVAGVVLTQDWFYYMLRGTSEPMLIGTSLWAIDRHLDRRYASAFLLAVATGLLRPEAWPLLAAYAIWLWIREPRLRVLIVVGLLAVPVGWFVPPWISTGQPLLAASHAHEYNGHLGSDPFGEVLRRGADLQVAPALILAAVAVVLSVLRAPRPLRWQTLEPQDRLTLAFAGLIVVWWAIVVGMTLVGYPGLERFFLPAAALTCVLAGSGVVRLGLLAAGRVRTADPRTALVAGGVVAAVLIGVSIPFTTSRISTARAQEPIASRAVTRLDQLSRAVAAVGGHRAVFPCHSSFVSVNHSVQTALAWKLHVTLGRVGTSMRHQGLMFLGPHDSIDGGAPAINHRLTSQQLIATAGVWRVYRMTTPGSSTRCVGR
ncbi:MAG TPA: hypothetical protein VGH24_13455 [Solirubrobacteraceae bacterium]